MNKITKKMSNRFNEEIRKIIEPLSIGKENHYKWTINTILGKLWITIHDRIPQQFIYSVFCKFENVERARKRVDCNPYSGKYNFNMSNFDYFIYHFKKDIERLTEREIK